MTMLYSPEYLAQLQEKHAGAGWGKGGVKWLGPILEKFSDGTIIDYGCGKGNLVEELLDCGCDAVGYDPAVYEYAATPYPVDYVVSTDVLEHIEPECLDEVLAHIAALTKKKAFLVISLVPAVQTLPDGRNAHLIVESAGWWTMKLAEHFPVVHTKFAGTRDQNLVCHCYQETEVGQEKGTVEC